MKLCRLSGDDVFNPASELPTGDVGVCIELQDKRPMHGQVNRVVVWLRHSRSWCEAQWLPAMPLLLRQKHNGIQCLQS
jgi:hypothetical protein